jgi:hypothetical protein
MKVSTVASWAAVALITAAVSLNAQQAAAPGANRQAEFGTYPSREFIRLNIDKFKWNATEGNKLGVQTAILEGDPSKPGFYLTINRFPPNTMSRPHTHPDERHCVVLKGTWYTGEGTKTWEHAKEVGLKPGEFMRHPSGGLHYDGAHDEEVWVLISGYGPTRADVLDKGELFGKIK